MLLRLMACRLDSDNDMHMSEEELKARRVKRSLERKKKAEGREAARKTYAKDKLAVVQPASEQRQEPMRTSMGAAGKKQPKLS